MLVTCRQMREAEERLFTTGVSAAELMDEAGRGIAEVVRQFFPKPGALILYLGAGNNAGDALVAARELRKDGWRLHARLSAEPERMKDLPLNHWRALPEMQRLESAPDRSWRPAGPLVLLDGLLGIGAAGELRPGVRALAAEMNALRQSHQARTVAMDIPSGLDGDTGIPAADAVIADITAVVGCIKSGLVTDPATAHVGRISLVPLAELRTCEGDDFAQVLTPEVLRPWLPRRAFEMHKGQAGRVGVLAGSRGYLGAARLACEGALRAGAGLVTLLVKEEVYPLLVTTLPPEIMVKPVADYREALDMRFDALAVGPGLGFGAEAEILDVLRDATAPAVIDADALTMAAKFGLEAVRAMPGARLLTPHPGEMSRLITAHPEWRDLPRRALAEAVAAELPGHVCLLKGARTVIACQGAATLFNSTGHPGMATGGMGDVLTGVCAAYIGQGLALHQAAGVGAWLCGRAAEIASLGQAQESVLPTDVIRCLGRAWGELLEGAR